MKETDCLVMEVSSPAMNLHKPTGHFLHSNLNFLVNASYSDIYPDGFYKKFADSLSIVKLNADADILTAQLDAIKNELPNANIVVIGNLRSDMHQNSVRDSLHRLLVQSCSASGCMYFDTAPFLDEYGFSHVNGVRDIHHLTSTGELAFGQAIQKLFISS